MAKLKKIFRIVGIIFFLWAIFQAGCYVYWFTWDVSYPFDNRKSAEEINSLPSKKLISMLYYDYFDIFSQYPGRAMGILAQRKEKDAVPHLIKFLKAWHRYKRLGAIRALAQINDSRAIKPLMEVVKKTQIDSSYNEKFPPYEYFEVLTALAKMKYEGVYHYAVEFASSKYGSRFFKGQAITMFEYFEKPESIPLLKKIAKDNSELLLRKGVLDTIRHIESLQKQKNK